MDFKDIKECWEKIVVFLEDKFDSKDFYETYFKKITILKIIDRKIFFLCPNILTKKIIIENFKELITKKILDYLNINYSCEFLLENEKINMSENSNYFNTLNSNMTFDNYIIGEFNKGILTIKDKLYNNVENFSPIFIFGSTGVGKTHALYALGNHFKLNNPFQKILYLNAEDFLTEAYKSISKGGEFIESYKNSFDDVDFLIVDDIQFLSNKKKLNEIFFSIFNRMYENGKVIILASDKAPNILVIDERMSSRFRSGVVINIKSPDSNSIEKIIDNYGKKYLLSFTEDSIVFLVNRFGGDVRILIGILKKISFNVMSNENGNKISRSFIDKILGDEIENGLLNTGYKIHPIIIIETIAAIYQIDKIGIISKSRERKYKKSRDVCIYVIRKKLNIPYSEIGILFSNRSHSTILESYKKSEKMIEKSEEFKVFIEDIIKKI